MKTRNLTNLFHKFFQSANLFDKDIDPHRTLMVAFLMAATIGAGLSSDRPTYASSISTKTDGIERPRQEQTQAPTRPDGQTVKAWPIAITHAQALKSSRHLYPGSIEEIRHTVEGKEFIRDYSQRSDFRIGAIISNGKAKLYTSDRRDEFIRDAVNFIDTHDITEASKKEFDAGSGECVDGNGGCISIYSEPDSHLARTSRVEAIFTAATVQGDEIIKTLGEELLAKSLATSDLSLCSWLRHLPKPNLSPAWAERMSLAESRILSQSVHQ